MWFLIAAILAVLVPGANLLGCLFWGVFGRLYIVFWLIHYREIWIGWLKLLNLPS